MLNNSISKLFFDAIPLLMGMKWRRLYSQILCPSQKYCYWVNLTLTCSFKREMKSIKKFIFRYNIWDENLYNLLIELRDCSKKISFWKINPLLKWLKKSNKSINLKQLIENLNCTFFKKKKQSKNPSLKWISYCLVSNHNES